MKLVLPSIISSVLLLSCMPKNNLNTLAGEAQGTTWHISYLSQGDANLKTEIDSVLKDLDLSLSTYVPASIISRINRNDSSVSVDNYFEDVFKKSMEVSEKTGGLFDVTVAPIINAWGFGFTKKAHVNKVMIDSLLQFVGYKMVQLEGNKVVKSKPQIMFDFNAIAQGYSVDVLASYLDSKGIVNYLVELGGEVKAKGKKNEKEYWKVGIDQPNEIFVDGRPLQAVVQLTDRALATSGNYRKFYVENGQKYAHIINPQTGYPEKHNLLSATVIARDCMTADAYATAFMVMGLEKTKRFLSENPALNLEVHLIYDDENGSWKTFTSESLKEWIEEVP